MNDLAKNLTLEIKSQVCEALITALQKVDILDLTPDIDFPSDLSHGDLTTNIAFIVAKKLGTNPVTFAEQIVSQLEPIAGVEKITVATPGFINFTLEAKYIYDFVAQVNDDFGKNTSLEGKKILIEKSAPNLFKPFHVGHLLNLSVGESLARLNHFSGAEVVDIAYPSDISLGVAKAVWSIMKNSQENEMTIDVLGKAYVDGTKQYEDDEVAKAEIDQINIDLNEKKSGPAWEVYEKGRKINLEYFSQITKRLDSNFSDIFFESEAGQVGLKIVLEHKGDVFEESNGAIIFKGEDYGLHTRVFVNSKGLPVYETKDIGLLKLKFDKYQPDLSVVITDIEQKQYFEVIKKAASLINSTWGENSLYWQHGRLRFEGGKISSRYGNVPLAEDLIAKVAETIKQMEFDIPPETLEQISIGALKYAFLRAGAGKNIVFDFKKSVSLNGDSGPYLQYSYVRAKSVLEKSEKTAGAYTDSLEDTPEFARLLLQFPDVVIHAAKEYVSHHVTTYLTELASSFNSWYANNRIIDNPHEEQLLTLVDAFAKTMKNGLWLLGIPTPDKM